MSQPENQSTLFVETHRNHYLFSDYYLDNRVQDLPEWRSINVQKPFQEFTNLWQGFTPDGNEAQTEQDWIRPVLQTLGHTFNVQVSISTPLGTRVPDYIFYADEASRQTHIGSAPLGDQELQTAVAVGDAKAWDRPLDQPIRTTHHATIKTSENPSFQIDFYVRHTGLPWGILTNGRLWRIYHTGTSKKLDVFYEVDLPALIEQQDSEAFKYFYLFFCRNAFVGPPTWLETVLAESQSYEQGVSDKLKDQVYEALRELAQGFLDFPANKLQFTHEMLKTIYDNSLIVLYRLLFILYAESRGLLPVNENSAYTQSYSLYSLKNRIARDLFFGTSAVPSMSLLWDQLHQLWQVLSTGNDHLDVPAYNGGLFDPAQHPFLEEYRVGDIHLRQAIDLLARAEDPATGRREFVDYRDLEIRHLGSIYEGLLEYQLRYADEPLAIRTEQKREVYVTADNTVVTPAVPAGQVYLITDKGERKATGSYYTPDYIVQYIVEETVGPVLDMTRKRFCDSEGRITDEAGLVNAIMALNVLDPAMGSGHFLVAATDFIARYLVSLGLEPEMLDGVGELAYWRRRVVQACIYGVDLNYLAVELAKLSLWLNTVAKDKPLSFLDHHLRCGNSLIGSLVADLQLSGTKRSRYRERKERAAQEAGQISMLEDDAFVGAMRTATGSMDQIESLKSETLADVQQAKHIYEGTVRATTRNFRLLADIWTARHFGLEMNDGLWNGLVQHILRGGFEVPQYKEILDTAQQIAQERRFFHWELEFPEVFFDQHGQLMNEDQSGFDVAISNPPYIDIKGLEKLVTEYLFANYPTLYFRINIFAAFLARALDVILQGNGAVGFIIPTAFLTQVSYVRLRKLLLDNYWLTNLVRMPNELFGEAAGQVKVDTCVVTVRTLTPSKRETNVLIYDSFDRINYISSDTASTAFVVPQQQWSNDKDSVLSLSNRYEHSSITTKMQLKSTPLEECCEFCLGLTPYDKYAGQTKDQIENKIFHAKAQLDPSYRKLLVSGDVKRYIVQWNGEEWIKYGAWLAAPREQRFFTSERILVQQIIDWTSLRILVGWTDEELYNTQNQFNLIARGQTNLKFILAIFNSKLIAYYHRRLFLDVALQRFQKILIKDAKTFPIRHIDFITPLNERRRLTDKGQRLYDQFCTKWDYACVLGFVNHQLSQEPERADVIHDLLVYLSDQMIDLRKQDARLEAALDPFKYVDAGAQFVKLVDAFVDEIKYGHLLTADLSKAYHDLEGLRLTPTGDEWELQAQLKLRDPDSDWQAWQYTEDGGNIVRQWISVYRFSLDATKARYYRHALPVLDRFANAGSFPGGRTRTTYQKLHLCKVPTYAPEIDLTPLEELIEELSTVRLQIQHTDALIDRIVYHLYGLTDEEIAIVENAL